MSMGIVRGDIELEGFLSDARMQCLWQSERATATDNN